MLLVLGGEGQCQGALEAVPAGLRLGQVPAAPLGTSFSNPDVLDGATLLGPGRANDAPAHYLAVVWDAAAQHVVYRGPSRQMP